MPDFKGKSAVVLGTSATTSMGAKVAAELIEQGARVMIAARREAEVAAAAKTLGAVATTCDITIEDDVAALADRAIAEFGKLDFAINAAGVAIMGDIANTDEKYLRRAVDTHLVGPFFFFKHMQRAIDRDGAMITISSITATNVINNHAAYVAAKAGTEHLVRIAAVEFGPRNIRVNSVAPGFTGDTPMSEGFMQVQGLQELFENEIPLGRLNTADDVAHAVLWLCDPKTYMTGQTIQVNGGHSLTRMPSRQEFQKLYD